jgi:uncharacterized protein (TIGR02588 family)
MTTTVSHKNWLEWTVFAVGLLLLLGTVGYLAGQALTRGRSPAVLSITLGEPQAHPDATPPHFVVPVTVRNDGARTAAEVDVEVLLARGDQVERRELTFEYVPRGSSRSGAVTFEVEPDPGSLAARVLTFLDP